MKRYVRERGSSTVRKLLREPVVTSRLSEVEISSALARLAREGAIPAAERDRALEALTEDFETFWVVELTAEVVGIARMLLVRHSLRAADAIQLASCLHVQREVSEDVPLVVFDKRLADAATTEAIRILPLLDPKA